MTAKRKQQLDIEQVVFDAGKVTKLVLCDQNSQELIEVDVIYYNKEIRLYPLYKITLAHASKLVRLVGDYNKLGRKSIGL